MAYELKPCPFCGGDVLNVTKDSFYHILQCDQCGVEKAHTRKHKLIKGWNRRADLACPKVKPLEWVEGTYTTTDDDNGPMEGRQIRLWAWRADIYTIIRQRGPDGLYVLRNKSDGIGAVVPTLEAAKAAAQADYERRIIAALEGE